MNVEAKLYEEQVKAITHQHGRSQVSTKKPTDNIFQLSTSQALLMNVKKKALWITSQRIYTTAWKVPGIHKKAKGQHFPLIDISSIAYERWGKALWRTNQSNYTSAWKVPGIHKKAKGQHFPVISISSIAYERWEKSFMNNKSKQLYNSLEGPRYPQKSQRTTFSSYRHFKHCLWTLREKLYE